MTFQMMIKKLKNKEQNKFYEGSSVYKTIYPYPSNISIRIVGRCIVGFTKTIPQILSMCRVQ